MLKILCTVPREDASTNPRVPRSEFGEFTGCAPLGRSTGLLVSEYFAPSQHVPPEEHGKQKEAEVPLHDGKLVPPDIWLEGAWLHFNKKLFRGQSENNAAAHGVQLWIALSPVPSNGGDSWAICAANIQRRSW